MLEKDKRKVYKTEQEEFWRGDFGNQYIERNNDNELLAGNLVLFSKIISNTSGIRSIIEFGANIGLNLMALKSLLPNIDEISAIEINEKAVNCLRKNMKEIEIHNQSILEYRVEKEYDFVLSKGVLIHINPIELNSVYEKLYESSKKYICIAEYYNPTPISVNYRGFSERLFKRDFAGDMLELYKNLKLVDYGFGYRKDNNYNFDDITWFLLKKV